LISQHLTICHRVGRKRKKQKQIKQKQTLDG